MRRFCFGSLCAVFIVLTCLSAGIAAPARQGTYTISAGMGGYHFEGDQCYQEDSNWLDPFFTAGFGLGYNFTDNWTAEVLFHDIDAEFRNRSVDTYLYRLNFLYHFPAADGKTVLFVSAGPGAINFNFPYQDNRTDFLVNFGAGLNYYLTEKFALRADASQIITVNPTFYNFMYTAGFSYLLGGAKKEPPKPPDSDGDSVIDINDQCPGTPAGVAVDAVGCPPDRDGDGFYDYLDKCPDVPGPGTVDGCPVPPAEAPKEEAAPVIRMRLNVEFDTDKADVKARYHDEIGRLVEVLKKYPAATVALEGHTDNSGSDNYNLRLSQQRVDSVKKYLIDAFGVEGARITAIGYGETKPVADNATEAGRQANRRVEAEIVPQPEVTP